MKKSVGFESGDVALARVEGTMSELNRNELISNISVSEELKFRQKNRRRLPRSLRKDRAKGKLLKKWRSISGEMTDNLNNFDYCDIDSGELVGAEEFDDYEEYDEGSEDGLVIEVINSSILPSMNNSSDNLNSFSDSGKQKSFSYEMFPTIPVLRVQRPVKTPALEVFSKSDYEDWLVLTTVNDLKEIGFRAFYRRQRFKLSSTEQTFNIPR